VSVNDQSSLAWPKRVTGIAGLTAGVGMLTSLVLNLILVPTVIDAVGVDALTVWFSVAAWLTIGGSAAALVGYGWGRWLSRPFWVRGLLPLLAGLGLGWGWYLLNRYVDLWGFSIRPDGASGAPGAAILSTVVILGVSAVAAVLVMFGAIRVLTSSPAVVKAEPATQEV
jgi:hypothetical protein